MRKQFHECIILFGSTNMQDKDKVIRQAKENSNCVYILQAENGMAWGTIVVKLPPRVDGYWKIFSALETRLLPQAGKWLKGWIWSRSRHSKVTIQKEGHSNYSYPTHDMRQRNWYLIFEDEFLYC
jgi:hypothetical protein